MIDIAAIASIIAEGEYDRYGLRAHRSEAVVGETLGKSRVWVDGDITDEELPGISTIRIESADAVEATVRRLESEYCWDEETIVLVGGNSGEWGVDDGEYIIRDNVCLAVVSRRTSVEVA